MNRIVVLTGSKYKLKQYTLGVVLCMTKAFDDKARTEYLAKDEFGELNYNNTPVKDMIIKEVSVKFARPYIATYHYSQTMPDSTKYVFAGYYKDKLAGIVVYGMGTGKNQYTALIPSIQKGEYLELTRLWSPDSMPKNTESKLISESLKMLPNQYKLIISFADGSRMHVGTIYQASNWYYCGISNGGRVLVTEDGVEKHTRLLGIYKMRHPELKEYTNEEIMKMYGWTYGVSHGKHRYCYLRGSKKQKKEMFRLIKNRIQEYPKIDNL